MHFCPEEAAVVAAVLGGGSTAVAFLRYRLHDVFRRLSVARLVLARALRRVT